MGEDGIDNNDQKEYIVTLVLKSTFRIPTMARNEEQAKQFARDDAARLRTSQEVEDWEIDSIETEITDYRFEKED